MGGGGEDPGDHPEGAGDGVDEYAYEVYDVEAGGIDGLDAVA